MRNEEQQRKERSRGSVCKPSPGFKSSDDQLQPEDQTRVKGLSYRLVPSVPYFPCGSRSWSTKLPRYRDERSFDSSLDGYTDLALLQISEIVDSLKLLPANFLVGRSVIKSKVNRSAYDSFVR